MSTTTKAGIVPGWDMADRLRKSLRVGGLSVQEMADYLGVERNTVGRYINGRSAPDVRTLRLWAIRTGVSLDWLADDDAPALHKATSGRRSRLPRLDLNQRPSDYTSGQVTPLRRKASGTARARRVRREHGELSAA